MSSDVTVERASPKDGGQAHEVVNPTLPPFAKHPGFTRDDKRDPPEGSIAAVLAHGDGFPDGTRKTWQQGSKPIRPIGV
jgi:hypothetical protein